MTPSFFVQAICAAAAGGSIFVFLQGRKPRKADAPGSLPDFECRSDTGAEGTLIRYALRWRFFRSADDRDYGMGTPHRFVDCS